MSRPTLNKTEKAKFFQAAKNNDLETVKHYIEGNSGNAGLLENDEGRTIVHIAARNGHLDIVKYLLEDVPARRNSTSKVYNPHLCVLDDAIFGGAIDVVDYLVRLYKVNLPKAKDCDRILDTTISYDRLAILKYFVEKNNVDVNVPCGKLSEPLIFAAVKYKRREMIKYLIEEKEADLKLLNYLDDNVLYPAAEVGDLTFMKYVLEEKKMEFDINRTNCLGKTVLYVAAAANQTDVVKYLVDEKLADVNIPNYNELNTTCLHQAVANNNYEMCDCLILRGARIEEKHTYGRVMNERVMKLLEMSTSLIQERKRRSVDQRLSPVPYYVGGQQTIDEDLSANADRYLSDGTATGRFYDKGYFPQLRSFLLIARLVINVDALGSFSSPRKVVVEPSIAEDAIYDISNFLKP